MKSFCIRATLVAAHEFGYELWEEMKEELMLNEKIAREHRMRIIPFGNNSDQVEIDMQVKMWVEILYHISTPISTQILITNLT